MEGGPGPACTAAPTVLGSVGGRGGGRWFAGRSRTHTLRVGSGALVSGPCPSRVLRRRWTDFRRPGRLREALGAGRSLERARARRRCGKRQPCSRGRAAPESGPSMREKPFPPWGDRGWGVTAHSPVVCNWPSQGSAPGELVPAFNPNGDAKGEMPAGPGLAPSPPPSEHPPTAQPPAQTSTRQPLPRGAWRP